MKVAAKAIRSLAALRQSQQGFFLDQIDLVEQQDLLAADLGILSMIASFSSSMPLRASISSTVRSASCAPPHAVVTMARSSRRLGAKIPGVSTKISCDAPSIAMPRTSMRVVCTLCETIETLEPTSALMSVDLPALGAPISATKPQRVSSPAAISHRRAHPRARAAPMRRPVRPRAWSAPCPRPARVPARLTATRKTGS